MPGQITLTLKIGDEHETLEGHARAAGSRTHAPTPPIWVWRLPASNSIKTGITVDKGLRTSNRRVYAIGDVAGGLQFTHVANDDAGIFVRRALFRLPAKTTGRAVPWVTFTDPELAHVGLMEGEARAKYGKVHVLRWSYSENDRAQAERDTRGHVKVVTSPKGIILGATIAGAQAGELIQMWSLAISQSMKIRAMTELDISLPDTF